MYKVTENIYQGGMPVENKVGIEAIVSLMTFSDGIDSYALSMASLEDIRYRFHFPIADGFFPGIKWLKTVVSTIEHLEKLDYKIYIHCRAGMSRSAMVTIAYLMYKNSWSVNEAMDHLGSINSTIDPNPYFIQGLREYEKVLKGNS